MPLKNYGVWKATPIDFKAQSAIDDPESPHGKLVFEDGGNIQELESAINLKSLSDDSRLVYWLIQDFKHPIRERLHPLEKGWHNIGLKSGTDPNRYSLDLLRDELVDLKAGQVVPHDIDGDRNDIIDFMKPFFANAIAKEATVYVFGEQYRDKDGVHDVHMNQGSGGQFTRQNGTYQDGGVILEFEGGHWEAFFIAFASQAVKTRDDGSPDGDPFSKFLNSPPTGGSSGKPPVPPTLPPDGPRETGAVSIVAALVNPDGADNVDSPEKVFLKNATCVNIPLGGWKIENKAGESYTLPSSASVTAAGEHRGFEVPGVALSNKGGSITLKDVGGKTVDKVSYTKEQASQSGTLVYFK
ncbi:Fc.00g007080.m01.CDS01 [Cosmosporella sp. VM-42]